MSAITFYAKKKINNLLAIELESHTTLDHIGCIDIKIYVDKFGYYKKQDRLTTIGEMLENIKDTLDNLINWNNYRGEYYIDDEIPDVIKTDLLQTALIKLLKNEINDMEDYEECQ